MLVKNFPSLLLGSKTQIANDGQEAAIRQFFLDAAGAAGLGWSNGLCFQQQRRDVVLYAG